MALQNDTSRIQYNGNNSTTNSYAIPFVFFENSHIKCVVTTSSGVDTELTLGSTFNVTGAGNQNGGSLTTTTAVPTSSKVTIFRNVPATQTTSYQEGGDFPAASHERALDKLTMIAQQTKRLADRALKVPETQNNPNDLPNASTGAKLLASNNGAITWEENRQLPPSPSTAGTQALVAAGSGAPPSWQTIPSIAPGPITATGSTTPRFIADRFAEVVHVDDYGAVGDGLTDDRNAIQAAINAAVARGSAVIEFGAGKTYNLHAFSSITSGNTWPNGCGRRHLELTGGTQTSRFFFRGNGARLLTNNNVGSNLSLMLVIASELETLHFENLIFERGPQRKVTPQFQGGESFITMRPVSDKYIDRVSFHHCNFVNGFAFVIDNRGFSVTKTSRKLRLLECRSCNFVYPYGGCTAFDQGVGQMVNMSGWVDTFVADSVFVDGAVGGVIPSDVSAPKDGWLYVNAHNTFISNSTFLNCAIETLIFEGVPDEAIFLDNYTQPQVNSTVTVSVSQNQNQFNEHLKPGQVCVVFQREGNVLLGRTTIHGVYEVVNEVINYTAGSTFQLRRLPDSTVVMPTNVTNIGLPAAGQTVSGFKALMPLHRTFAAVTNCAFGCTQNVIKREDGSRRIARINITNGGSGYTTAPTVSIAGSSAGLQAVVENGAVTAVNIIPHNGKNALFALENATVAISGGGGNGAAGTIEFQDWGNDPAILAKVATTVTNCFFDNFVCAASINPTYYAGHEGPVVFAGNLLFGREQPLTGRRDGSMILCNMPNAIISNNVIIAEDINSHQVALFCGREGQIIAGNLFLRRNASIPGETSAAINLFNTADYADWDMDIQNNIVRGWNFGVSGFASARIWQLQGSFVTKAVNIWDFKGGILSVVKPNGNVAYVRVTNDDELLLTNNPFT